MRKPHDISPRYGFESACRTSLEFLAETTGYRCWLVSKLYRDQWMVTSFVDRCYGVTVDQLASWAELLCVKLVSGDGPPAAPNIREVPCYASLTIGPEWPIRAYMAAPLTGDAGQLLGMLCGLDPAVQPADSVQHLPLVEQLARLLVSIQHLENVALEKTRLAERAEALAIHDALTGLINRRGWDQLVSMEEQRWRRHGGAAVMFYIDLDHLKSINDEQGHAAGDATLQRAALAIRKTIRHYDLVARIGGDEFAALATGCDAEGAAALRQRLQESLSNVQVAASIGFAFCSPDQSFQQTLAAADQEMLAAKKRKYDNRSTAR